MGDAAAAAAKRLGVGLTWLLALTGCCCVTSRHLKTLEAALCSRLCMLLTLLLLLLLLLLPQLPCLAPAGQQ
jgi:hypothetical protein